MNPVHRTVRSPIGPLVLEGDGTVLTRLRLPGERRTQTGASAAPTPDWSGASHGPIAEDPQAYPAVVEQLEAYFAGALTTFDVPVRLEGSPFQREVWAELRRIPYGETISYGELAARVGRPGAARAVGLANGRNPVAIIVPCHRVIGSNGALVGYGGGLPAKQALLDLERAHRTPRLPVLA